MTTEGVSGHDGMTDRRTGRLVREGFALRAETMRVMLRLTSAWTCSTVSQEAVVQGFFAITRHRSIASDPGSIARWRTDREGPDAGRR